MSIWKREVDLKQLQDLDRSNTIASVLGISITEVGDDFVRGTMPVDHRTHQPFGILHGGASVVLAESLGSIAAMLACEPGYYGVGLDVTASHLRSVSSGLVTGTARPVRIGRSIQVWDIDIVDEQQRRVCVSRLTCAVRTMPE